MNEPDLLRRVERDGVRWIRFAYCDLAGISRCKAIHVSQLPYKLVEGVSLSRAQFALNALNALNALDALDNLVHVPGLRPVGEVRLHADPSGASRTARSCRHLPRRIRLG